MQTASKEETELIQKFEKVFQREKLIVDAFNSLSVATYEKYHSNLEIKEEDKLIIFQLVENKLKYLEQSAFESSNNIRAILSITVFKCLFIGEKAFKIKGLTDKINYFNVLLKLLKDEELKGEKELKIIYDMLNEIEFNQNYLLNQIIQDYDGKYFFAYCFYLINNSCISNKFFFDIFITFIKAKYKQENEDHDLEIKIDENINEDILAKLSMNILLLDLYKIYSVLDNYMIIFIENGRLSIKKMEPKEIENIFQKYNQDKEKKKKKSKKKNKTKKEKQETENNNNTKYSEISQKGKENNINENPQKDEKKLEDNMYANNEINCEKEKEMSFKNALDNKNNSDEKEVQLQEIKNSNNDAEKKELSLDDKIEHLNSIINQLIIDKNESQKQIKNLMIDNSKLQEEIKSLKSEADKNKKKHGKYKRIIKNMKFNIEEISNKSIKIENELNLIQLRDSFKNIIDLFAKAFAIPQEKTYIDKVTCIKGKISKSKLIKTNKQGIIDFFDRIYFDLQFSNKNAHTIDITKPILEQIFNHIDRENSLSNIRNKLEEGKLNHLLKELAVSRNNNFNDKERLINEEKRIIDTVKGISDILP